MEPFISFEKVTKTYRMGEVDIKALDGVDFFVNKGEFAIVVESVRRRKRPPY